MAKAVGLQAWRRALTCALLLAAMACPALAQAQVGGANGWLEARTFNHAGYGDSRVELVAADGTDAAPAVPWVYDSKFERTIYGGEGTAAINQFTAPSVPNDQVHWVGARVGKTTDMAGLYASPMIFPGTPAEDRLCDVRARVIAARPDGTLVWQRYWSAYHRGTAALCGSTDTTKELKVDYVHTSATGAVLAMFPRVVLQRSSVPEGSGRFFATADPDVLFESGQESGAFAVYRHVLSTGERTLVRAGIPTTFWPGDVSPDGRLLLNTFGPDLQVMDVATGTVTTVLTAAAAAAVAPASGTGTSLEEGQFSPDGALIGFRRDNTTEAGGSDTLMTVGIDGSSARVVRALAAGRAMGPPAWSVIAGVPVSGLVMQRACGTTSCRREPLDGTTITATRAGAAPVVGVTGDDGKFRLALTKGTWTLTPSLRDAIFDPKTKDVAVDAAEVKDVDFDTCGPSPQPVEPGSAARLLQQPLLEIKKCQPDFVVDAVEVVQRVQAEKWWTDAKLAIPGVKGAVPGGYYRDGDASPHARATVNVKGVSTTVRVYVRVNDGFKDVPAPDRVELHVFAGGSRVTLQPVSRPKALNPAPNLYVRRFLVDESYNFALPPELASAGSLTFMAEILPAKGKECPKVGGKDCKANNRWALARVPFRTTRPFVVRAFNTRVKRPNGTTAVTGVPVSTALGQAARYLPFRFGDVRYGTGRVIVDAVSPTILAQRSLHLPETGVLEDCLRIPDCTKPFYEELGLETLGVTVAEDGVMQLVTHDSLIAAGGQGVTWTDSRNGRKVSLADRDPLTIAHELGHSAGLGHASSATSCREQAKDAEPWPDQEGTIVGWGLDPARRDAVAPSGAFDVMSYCADLKRAWISNYHWNKLVELFGVGRASRATREGPTLAAGAGLHVLAAVHATGPPSSVRVSSVRAAPSRADAAGTVVVTAYDEAGAAIATVRTAGLSGSDGSTLVDVVLPVADAARVEVARDGAAAAAVVRSATAPVVRLTTQRGRTVVGLRTRLRVAWTATDADGDVLRSEVQYAADGRTWRTVASVGADTEIVLPAGFLTAARNGRLRVVVGDGLRWTTVTSGPLRVVGAAPRIVPTSKATLRLATGVRGELAAYAMGENGVLPARSLRWSEGRKALGRGERIAVRYAKKGTHTISLVATDGTGLKSTKTFRVIVR